MKQLPDIFEKFFNDPLMNMGNFGNAMNQFVNVQQYQYTDKDGNYVLEIDVPGFNKDSLTVEIDEDLLTVRGQLDRRKVDRTFRISRDASKVHAKITDGVLILTFEKHKKTVPLTIE